MAEENQNSNKERWIQILLVVVLLGLLLFANWQFARQNHAGVDFLIRWLPTRLVLFEGLESPYAAEATRRVELFQSEQLLSDDPIEGYFLYPHYFMLFTLPFALFENFTIARVLWMTLLEVSQIGIVILSLQVVSFKPKHSTLLLLLLVALISSFFIQPIIDGNPSSLSGLFMAVSLYFLWQKKDGLAGAALALSTIKPQMVVLFCALMWLWAFSQKRWKVLLASGVGVLVLMAGSFLIQPTWFGEFIQQVSIYQGIQDIESPNNPAGLLSVYFPSAGSTIAMALNVVCVVLILIEWVRCYGKSYRHFFWTVSITFALLPLTSIAFGNRNLVVLLPAIVMIAALFDATDPKRTLWLNLGLSAFFIYSWVALSLPGFFSFKNYLPFAAVVAVLLFVFRKKFIAADETNLIQEG